MIGANLEKTTSGFGRCAAIVHARASGGHTGPRFPRRDGASGRRRTAGPGTSHQRVENGPATQDGEVDHGNGLATRLTPPFGDDVSVRADHGPHRPGGRARFGLDAADGARICINETRHRRRIASDRRNSWRAGRAMGRPGALVKPFASSGCDVAVDRAFRRRAHAKRQNTVGRGKPWRQGRIEGASSMRGIAPSAGRRFRRSRHLRGSRVGTRFGTVGDRETHGVLCVTSAGPDVTSVRALAKGRFQSPRLQQTCMRTWRRCRKRAGCWHDRRRRAPPTL